MPGDPTTVDWPRPSSAATGSSACGSAGAPGGRPGGAAGRLPGGARRGPRVRAEGGRRPASRVPPELTTVDEAAALAELVRARDRVYYDAEADSAAADAYYGDTAPGQLADLVRRTHVRTPRYAPAV